MADQVSVKSSHFHQVVMRSSLYDPTIAHNKNFVGSPNGRKTMSDDDCHSINHQLIESPANMRLTGCIEMGRCLIEDEDRSVFEECPRDGNPLSLPTG